jgi:hypothetical protein
LPASENLHTTGHMQRSKKVTAIFVFQGVNEASALQFFRAIEACPPV